MHIFVILLICIFVALTVFLIVAAGVRRNRRFLVILSVLMWLSSIISACFIWIAWQERAYSENWAMLAVFLISAPVIIINGILSLAALVVSYFREIPGRKPVCYNVYILLMFLAIQVIAALMAL